MAARHIRAGDAAEAYRWATAGLARDPESGSLHELAGAAAYAQESWGPALYHLESASVFKPLWICSQLELAQLYLRFGQIEAAQAILDYLLEPDRTPAGLWPDLAKALGRAGQYEQACRICEQLAELRPGYHPAWFGVAYYRSQLGVSLDALEGPLRVAHELAPHSRHYRVALAETLRGLGRAAEAEALIAALPPQAVACLRYWWQHGG